MGGFNPSINEGPAGTSFRNLRPRTIVAATPGIVFDGVNVTAGTNFNYIAGMSVVASPGSNGLWALTFDPIPVNIPSGQLKARFKPMSNATTGVAKLQVVWAPVAVGEVPSTTAGNNEGTFDITFGAGDANKYKELVVPLDAVAVEAGDVIHMDLTAIASGYTLAQIMTLCDDVELFWE